MFIIGNLNYLIKHAKIKYLIVNCGTRAQLGTLKTNISGQIYHTIFK